jgi:hypothetical protein
MPKDCLKEHTQEQPIAVELGIPLTEAIQADFEIEGL